MYGVLLSVVLVLLTNWKTRNGLVGRIDSPKRFDKFLFVWVKCVNDNERSIKIAPKM